MKNCLTYAIKKYRKEKGYILIRKSKHLGIIPHFLHMNRNGLITHYAPKTVKKFGILRFLHMWHFDGEVLVGDE